MGDRGVRNHGINNVMAWKNPERSKEENEHIHASETFSASDHHAPELIVFIQESDCFSVKDIFIDSVVPSQGVLSYKESRKTRRILSSIPNEIEQDFQDYVGKQHGLGNLMKDGEADHLDGRDGYLLYKTSTGKIIPAGMQHAKEFQVCGSISLNQKERSASESIDDNSHLSEVSSNNDAEIGTTIHFSESSLTTVTEDRMSRSLKGPSQSFVRELGNGDCDPFAGISLRSTSSNASSHSFAFPILQPEGNGSPVRMAKAERRQLRKHQSWRACFLCCKF